MPIDSILTKAREGTGLTSQFTALFTHLSLLLLSLPEIGILTMEHLSVSRGYELTLNIRG